VIEDVRARLADAERLLDEGDYTASVRETAEAYAALVQERPDLIVGPRAFDELPIDRARDPVPQRGPWPEAQGVTVSIVEGAPPEIVLAKSRYTMSDAITYLEYTVDLLKLAER
jgi:hypothetical protein